MSNMLIKYIHTSLAKIGIQFWAPNLNAQPDALYNEAFQIAAIQTFCQAVAGIAYVYMNINKSFANNFDLLMAMYDHYVHYYMAGKYSKARREEGRNQRDEEKKVI